MKPQKLFGTKKWLSSEKRELKDLPNGEDLIDRDVINYDWNTIGKDHLKPVPDKKPMIKHHMKYIESFGVEFLRYVATETYGNLYRVRLKRENRILTCKVLSLNTFDFNKWRVTTIQESVKSMYHEISFLRRLSHPNIIQMFYDIRIPDSKTKFPYSYVCVLLEPTDGSLSDLIQRSTARLMVEKDCKEWFTQIIEGIRYLHQRNIVHMNIKPESIRFVIGKHKIFKLCDFCYTFEFGEGMPSLVSNIRIDGKYQSPEVRGVGPELPQFESKANDIWGLGVTLIAALIGLKTDLQVMIDGLRYREWEQMYSKCMPYPPSTPLAHLLIQMIETDPNDRLTIEEVCANKWLNITESKYN